MSRRAEPITVLFVDHAEAIGGAEQSLLLLLDHLDRSRFRPVLAANRGPLARAALHRGVPVRIAVMPKIRGRPDALWHLGRGAARLARIVRHERAAIVYSNVMRASFYAAGAARLTGRPLVWHVRDIHDEGWYLRLMCGLADRAIAISGAVAAPIPCREKTRIVSNGLDPEPFDRADGGAFRAEIGVGPDEVLIGIVGRVWPWKGQQTFLDAAARIAPRFPTVRFAVIGDVLFASERDYLAELRDHARTIGIAGRVVFTGHREDVPEVMAGLDLLVHASRAEPFGRVLIEAMAAARPIVAFGDGGVPEIVIDGETGRLVAPGDVEALAGAMAELIADPNRRRALGAAGRARVERLFTAAATARSIERILEEIG